MDTRRSTNSDNVTRRRQTSDVTDPGKRKYSPSRSRYNQARSRTKTSSPNSVIQAQLPGLIQLAGLRRRKRVAGLSPKRVLPGLNNTYAKILQTRNYK